ncbi:MAG: hypothetical protein GC149_03870 [Gammaproteobacteria bacterium]|nr:hypothetical protein [Gammaproteobacteria bacterium]
MTPDHSISLNQRPLTIELSPAAKSALAGRNAALYVQMELYFSCLLRLKVRFYETEPATKTGWLAVSDKLFVNFRPVMTAHCSNDYDGEEPPLTDFPIAQEAPFTPRWLQLDYRQGEWRGEFGYHQG